jgi:hypothetical protein
VVALIGLFRLRKEFYVPLFLAWLLVVSAVLNFAALGSFDLGVKQGLLYFPTVVAGLFLLLGFVGAVRNADKAIMIVLFALGVMATVVLLVNIYLLVAFQDT